MGILQHLLHFMAISLGFDWIFHGLRLQIAWKLQHLKPAWNQYDPNLRRGNNYFFTIIR